MNKKKGILVAVGIILAAAQFGTAYAEKVKKLEYLQDDAQEPFVSKVYTSNSE
jgi:hypothetical protein